MQNFTLKSAIFGGYNKQDVQTYIDDIISEKDTEIEEYILKIKSLEDINKTFIHKDELDRLICQKESEINLLKKQIEEYEYRSNSYREKSLKYDELSDKLEKILSDANSKASKIILDSQEKSKKIEEIAKMKEEQCKKHAEDVLVKAKKEYKELLETVVSSEEEFKNIFIKINNILSATKDKLSNMGNQNTE